MQLISVIVVTFNSSKFINETLDSIYAQTWKDLELIITDDCSTDSTIKLCQDWIKHNSNRFARVELIKAQKNTGIAANCNRGLRAARGEWIHFCSGDDAFLPSCIANNMDYITRKPETRILFSYCRKYADTFEEKNFLGLVPGAPPVNIINDTISAESQYRLLLLSDRITFTPSSFIQRQTLLDIGGFNESVKLQEDYPVWLMLTKAGHKLHFMEKETVKYRQHSNATNNMATNYLIKPNYFRTEDFRRKYVYPNLPLDIRLNQQWNWIVSQPFRNNQLNRKTRFNKLLYALLTIYLNPFRYFIYLKKRLSKNLKDNAFYA